MKTCRIDVLGTEYTVCVGTREELRPDVPDEWDGCCFTYDKTIFVVRDFEDVRTPEGKTEILKEILGHELAHAFLFESGFKVHEDEEDTVVWLSRNSFKLVNCVLSVLDELGEI